jgi:uncharacterized protein
VLSHLIQAFSLIEFRFLSVTKKQKTFRSGYFFYILAIVLIAIVVTIISLWSINSADAFDYHIFINGMLIGIFAQMIDGALGMAYGITTTTFLLSTGISPAVATGSTHIAEIFTTGASGLSHWKMGNVNKKLLKALIIPGIIGGVSGAFLITSIDGKMIRPWISGYLLFMGGYILLKAFKKVSFNSIISRKKITPLALFGGFIDSIGGGGWGPVVTSTLLGSGHEPKKTIGSVNAAEFFITIATGFSFSLLIGITQFEIVAGLIIGGITVAPLAAKLTSKLSVKILMILVGILIMFLSSYNIYNSF